MFRNQDLNSAGAGQQYQHSASSTSSFSFSPFSATMQGIMSTNFDSPRHLSPADNPAMPRPGSRSTPERQGHSRNKSGSLSPHLARSSPLRNSATAPFTPPDRALPSKDVTGATITEAYVKFILYCNPQISLDTDNTTLQANFQSPPKSDNKDFEVYRLFELIKRFDAKEIKTWAQLVMELGVEAPDTAKGQSVQKVQQYSVRLKRWMRAMHIDAFFEYLLDKQHAYFIDVPKVNEPYASTRDGVAAEEDLAIRALDPSLRPKRGRRRNSEIEAEDAADVVKRQPPQNALPASAYPSSALPMSAHPDGGGDPWAIASAVTPHNFAPWARNQNGSQSAINTSAPSQLRWQIQGPQQRDQSPQPMTAHPTTMTSQFEGSFETEPKSAITPSSRKRRKHGPAVSSAWNASGAPGAKPRGRPPASRNLQDGPFTTFPADPANEKGATQSYQAPPTQMEAYPATEDQTEPVNAPPPLTKRHSDGPPKKGRLSLQVPAHTGGPVRLATPPRVLVNGETDDTERPLTLSPMGDDVAPAPNPPAPAPQLNNRRPLTFADKEMPGFAFGILQRALASDLLRADLIGRSHRLTSDEARRLADAILERFNVPVTDGTAARDDIARLTAASWLGLGEHMNVPLGPATGQNKRISVTRFRVDAEGYEEIVPAHLPPSEDIRDVFDVSWVVSMGGCNGNFSLTGLRLSTGPQKVGEDTHDALLSQFAELAQVMGVDATRVDRAMKTTEQGARSAAENVDWKSRYMAMEFSARVAKGELDRVKERMLERILDAVM